MGLLKKLVNLTCRKQMGSTSTIKYMIGQLSKYFSLLLWAVLFICPSILFNKKISSKILQIYTYHIVTYPTTSKEISPTTFTKPLFLAHKPIYSQYPHKQLTNIVITAY